MLKLALTYIRDEKISGHYAEFGVARGTTFIAAYHMSKKLGSKIGHFHAFDSFQGFPEPRGVDAINQRFRRGEASFPAIMFETAMSKRSVNPKEVSIYPGWFSDTLTPELRTSFLAAGRQIAVAWIDCDMYQSTKEVLDFAAPLLADGCVVVFDDWLSYKGDPDKGEQRAAREFLDRNDGFRLIPFARFGIVGESFILSKASGSPVDDVS